MKTCLNKKIIYKLHFAIFLRKMMKLEQQNEGFEGCEGLGPNKLGFVLGDDDDDDDYKCSYASSDSNNYKKWFDKILLFIENIIGD